MTIFLSENNGDKKDFFQSLPPELLYYILSFLTPFDITHLSAVNKYLNTIANDNNAWLSFFSNSSCKDSNTKNDFIVLYKKMFPLLKPLTHYQHLLNENKFKVDEIMNQLLKQGSGKTLIGLVQCEGMSNDENNFVQTAMLCGYGPALYPYPHNNVHQSALFQKYDIGYAHNLFANKSLNLSSCIAFVIHGNNACEINKLLHEFQKRFPTLGLPFIYIVSLNRNLLIESIDYPVVKLFHLSITDPDIGKSLKMNWDQIIKFTSDLLKFKTNLENKVIDFELIKIEKAEPSPQMCSIL